jgi:hypothetical protein
MKVKWTYEISLKCLQSQKEHLDTRNLVKHNLTHLAFMYLSFTRNTELMRIAIYLVKSTFCFPSEWLYHRPPDTLVCTVLDTLAVITTTTTTTTTTTSRSQWLSGLRRGSTAACLLGLRVRISLGAWMSVSCEWCVWSSRGLCNKPIPRLEELYRLWCVIVCDLGISRMRWS